MTQTKQSPMKPGRFTPLWHGVKTEEELKSKMAELRALDYKPVIDRSVTETLL